MKSDKSGSKYNFIDRLVAYPGINGRILQFKKTFSVQMIILCFYVVFMTYLTVVFNVRSLFLYGIFILGWSIPFLFVFLSLRHQASWLVHVSSHFFMFLTLFIIVRLGGINHSGGIIFAPLNTLMTSIIFYSVGWAIWYFVLFFSGAIVIAIIQMHLKIPAEMTSEVNHLFFLINTLFICGGTLAQVLVYIKQFTQTEKDKAERLKELEEFRTKLYTNITHEFRTPLTVILGMADQIEANAKKYLDAGIQKIRNNGKNLLYLVNQMLDLAKLEAGALPLHMVQGDIIRYLKVLFESFHSMAEDKSIKINFKSDKESFLMDYDPERIKQILTNLLSNAIKFTEEGGSITLDISIDEVKNKEFKFRVIDTGIGISPDKVENIFDRFYQEERDANQTISGTGLGLAITKELVHLMKGRITVESQVNEGTVFRVILPVKRKAPFDDLKKPVIQKEEKEEIKNAGKINEDEGIIAYEKPVLLIVEDNRDVTEYLQSLLQDEYQIKQEDNGLAGLKTALDVVPDIILSDVMMPKMDGIQMLAKLKADVRTSHIPVIMLTAKADIASRLEGLETGADAYLAKPFDKEELLIRLKKLVELRQKLQARYATFNIPKSTRTRVFNREDTFMKKLHNSFDENLSDENFDIMTLCDILAMSRAQLYRKFKALTNRSIKEYLQSYRLHISKKILQESELNVTQVAFEVGFKNLSHFSHAFSKMYGIKPSEIRQKKV